VADPAEDARQHHVARVGRPGEHQEAQREHAQRRKQHALDPHAVGKPAQEDPDGDRGACVGREEAAHGSDAGLVDEAPEEGEGRGQRQREDDPDPPEGQQVLLSQGRAEAARGLRLPVRPGLVEEREREQERGHGEDQRGDEDRVEVGSLQDQVAEEPTERDGQHSGDAEEREPLGAARGRHQVGREREERGKEQRLRQPMQDAQRIDPGPDGLDREVEPRP